MKKFQRVAAFLAAAALALTACSGQNGGTSSQPEPSYRAEQQAYLDKVDVDYSYELTKKLTEFKTNEKLGYRTAGSEAEIAAGEMLKEEMEKIGLQNVAKDAIILDTWTFEKANLTFQTADGQEKTAVLGGYHTNFDTQGPKEFAVVYAGKGTAADLESLDVSGKLVLVDINQSEDWWINYPAYQAHLKGAAAVLAMQDGGYAEVSPDALNAQDVCGPADAPAFSISQTDAGVLKEAISASESGEITVTFDAKSQVGLDGTSYNIVGMIPGKDPDAMVMVSAHYDAYFDGFQDDSAAVALMMGIAKGLVDSGYQPEKTLVFCAMAAEEWGMTNTRYDWSTGAYKQVFEVHPEWAGKVIANINFEMPALNVGDTDSIRTSYELKRFMEGFLPAIPTVEGVFPGGVEIIVPTQTWSDDFSISIAGIPASVNSLRGDFSSGTYHSQFDNEETYSREAFLFHHYMYGLMVMEYDHCAVSPLDFSARFAALGSSVDKEIFTAYEVDSEALLAAVSAASEAAKAAGDKVFEVNASYADALHQGDKTKAQEILDESSALGDGVLAAFKLAQDDFVRLTWEDSSIFPHQHAQSNLANLKGAIAALEAGDGQTALDEYLYGVDNNWYAYDFDKETFTYFTDYVLNQPADRLMWGAGRVVGHEDLFDVIHAVQEKAGTEGADYTAEISALKAAETRQAELLDRLVQGEISSLEKLVAQLNQLAA